MFPAVDGDTNIILRAFYIEKRSTRINKMVLGVLQLLAIGFITMGTIGSSGVSSTSPHPIPVLSRIGYVGLLGLVIFTLFLSGVVLHRLERREGFQNEHNVHWMVHAVLMSLPFIFVRITYGVASVFEPASYQDPEAGSFPIIFLLIFMSELLATICLTFGGLRTRIAKA
jgi:hypothetical protein